MEMDVIVVCSLPDNVYPSLRFNPDFFKKSTFSPARNAMTPTLTTAAAAKHIHPNSSNVGYFLSSGAP